MVDKISLLTSELGLVRAIVQGMLKTDSNVAKNILFSNTKESTSRSLCSLVEKKCKYAIHALMLSLITVNCSEILDNMSAEQVNTLKKLLDQAKQYPQPDSAGAKMLADECYAKNSNGKMPLVSQKDNEITRLSACIAIQISDLRVWDDVVATLNKWSDTVVEYQQSVYVVSGSKDDVKSEPQKIEAKPVIKADDNHWPLEKLMTELGITYAQFRRIRDKIAKNNPELGDKMNSWFCHETGTQSISLKLFKAEHFDEMRELVAKHASTRKRACSPVNAVSAEKETWSMQELADRLGRTKSEVINDKFHLLRRHPGLKDTVESWFVIKEALDSRGRKHKIKVFIAEYFDEFVKLLATIKRYNKKSGKSKSETIKVAEQVSTEQTPDNILAVEHPTDLVGVQGLQRYLSGLESILTSLGTEQQESEQEYAELQKRADAVKAKIDANKVQAELVRQKIESANALLNAQMSAQAALEAAQKAYDERNAEIAKLLSDVNSDNK